MCGVCVSGCMSVCFVVVVVVVVACSYACLMLFFVYLGPSAGLVVVSFCIDIVHSF